MHNSNLSYEIDQDGNEILLKEGKHQVMMQWEKPYMEACIQALAPTGSVLEIGYGLGYSAHAIQAFHPQKHAIIECDTTVLEKAKAFASKNASVEIIQGTWQEALPTLGEFDAIFFDDYPLDSEKEEQKLSLLAPNLEAIDTGMKPSHFTKKDFCEFLDHLHLFPENEGYLLRFIQDSVSNKTLTPSEAKLLEKLAKERGYDLQPLELKLTSPRCDRLFQFLTPALTEHLKIGGKFSCYQETSQSKYEEPIFTQQIILNPCLEYHEEWIEVHPPEHCKYFEGTTALVMTIQKIGPVQFPS